MPAFLTGFTVTTMTGELLPALGQVLVSAGPPKVVSTTRAQPQESTFETSTDVVSGAAGLALCQVYRDTIGNQYLFNNAYVFVENAEPQVRPRKGETEFDVYCKWTLIAAREWVPDAD